MGREIYIIRRFIILINLIFLVCGYGLASTASGMGPMADVWEYDN
jgi:hypothetical protein